MTKAELIEAMKDMPDNARIYISCGFDIRDPAGWYNPKKISLHEDLILIEPEDE